MPVLCIGRRSRVSVYNSTREKGIKGEKAAIEHLRREGYKIIVTNFRTRMGEIDIIAKDGDVIVFVEVKSALSPRFGDPVGWVTKRKQMRIIRVSQAYMMGTCTGQCPVRYDVIGIDTNGGIQHIKDAFRPRGDFFM